MGHFESLSWQESHYSGTFPELSNHNVIDQEGLNLYLSYDSEQEDPEQTADLNNQDDDIVIQLPPASELVPPETVEEHANESSDFIWNRRREDGAIETFDNNNQLVQIETEGQIFRYEHGQIVFIENKLDQTFWSYDNGWRHYQSDGQVFDLPPYDLINYDQNAFQNGLEPRFQSQDGYSTLTFHVDGSSDQAYGNGLIVSFDAEGNLLRIQLPNGSSYDRSNGIWRDQNRFAIQSEIEIDQFGEVTFSHSTYPQTESTFKYNADGSYSIRHSQIAEGEGGVSITTATIHCLADGFVERIVLPDGSYLNNYPSEQPEWQRESAANLVVSDSTQLTITHADDAERLLFDGDVQITEDGQVLFSSDNWMENAPLFKPNYSVQTSWSITDESVWSIPLDRDTSEVFFHDGASATVIDGGYTLSSVNYEGISITGLDNGQIGVNSVIRLPDQSVITFVDGRWLHTVHDATTQPQTTRTEEVFAPQLNEYGQIDGIIIVQGGYQITTADGVCHFYLPDQTHITRSENGAWVTDDGAHFASILTVTPAERLIIANPVSNGTESYLNISTFNGSGWEDTSSSRLYFDESTQGQSLLASAVQAIIADPNLLLSELRTMTVADRLTLNQAYYEQTGEYLTDVAARQGRPQEASISTFLNRTSDDTDFVGQMHSTIALLNYDVEHGEQALLNLLMTGTNAEINHMRQEYQQLYGIDPFTAILATRNLSQGIRETLPILENGIDQILVGLDSNGESTFSDDAFSRMTRAAIQSRDIDLFSVAFQFSSQEQRERFLASEYYQNLEDTFSGRDLEIARDFVNDGSIRIDTLIGFNIHPFYIDAGQINSALENVPEQQREQYARGLAIVQANPALTSLDRSAALNQPDMTAEERADLEFYFMVHDALERASWNQNQIVDFGYSDSPTDTAKFEDRLLHGRETVISLCLNEIKAYTLGVGGTHYEPTAVLNHIQNMSDDDWALLRSEPTFQQQLKDALHAMLNAQDYALAVGMIDRMAAASTLELARSEAQLSGLDLIIGSRGRPDLTIAAVIDLSSADIQRYATNDNGIRSTVDAQIASLEEPARSLAQSLLASIPEDPDAQFQINLDPYQTIVADQVMHTTSSIAYRNIQLFLASTPADSPYYTQSNSSTFSATDMTRSFRNLLADSPIQSSRDYQDFFFAHPDDPSRPQLEGLWMLRTQLTNQIWQNMKLGNGDSYQVDNWTNTVVDDLITTGRLPLDLVAGPELSKSELLDLMLESPAGELRALLLDSNSRLYDLLGPAEIEVLLGALARTSDDSASVVLVEAEKLRLYTLGFGSLEQVQAILSSYDSNPIGLESLLQEYETSFHPIEDGGQSGTLYTDILRAYRGGDKEQLYNLIMNAPAAQRSMLLDTSQNAILSEILSVPELEILSHALRRRQDDPTLPPSLDSAEILRLFALGGRGGQEELLEFLRSLSPGARVAAIYEYSSSFHNGDSPANLLADMNTLFGDDTNVQLDVLCSIAPGDERQMFWDANASAFMRESGWSAYALRNGAREAMVQAQGQYFEDIARAIADGTINDPDVQLRLNTDLEHLENATDSYAEAKEIFTNNTVTLIGTAAALLLAPYVSLPYLIAGGTIFNIVAKASGLGYDADLSARALAIETVSSAFSFAALKIGGDIAQGIFKQMFESRIVSTVLSQIDDSYAIFNSAGIIQTIERAGLTWNRSALQSGLPSLVQSISSGADEATVFNVARTVARNMLGLSATTSDTIVNASYYGFADMVARGLIRETTRAVTSVAIPQLESYAIAVAAYEAIGIPFNIVATSAATVIDRWNEQQTIEEVFQNALAGVQAGIDSAPQTAVSIVAFVSLGHCIGMLIPIAGNRFSYRNTSTETQQVPYVTQDGRQITVPIEPNQTFTLQPTDRLLIGPGDAIPAPPGTLFGTPYLFQVPAYELTSVPLPANDALQATQPEGALTGDLAVNLLRLQGLANMVRQVYGVAAARNDGTTAPGTTGTTNQAETPEGILPFDDRPISQPDPPTPAQQQNLGDRLKRSFRNCLIVSVLGLAAMCGLGQYAINGLKNALDEMTERLDSTAPGFLPPAADLGEAANILRTLTEEKLETLPYSHTLINLSGEEVHYLTWQDVMNMPSSDYELAQNLMDYFFEISEHHMTSDGSEFVITADALQHFLELHNATTPDAVDAE